MKAASLRPPTCSTMRSTWAALPYWSSQPCSTSSGQRIAGSRYSMFQWRNQGLSQVCDQASNSAVLRSPW